MKRILFQAKFVKVGHISVVMLSSNSPFAKFHHVIFIWFPLQVEIKNIDIHNKERYNKNPTYYMDKKIQNRNTFNTHIMFSHFLLSNWYTKN